MVAMAPVIREGSGTAGIGLLRADATGALAEATV